MEMFVAFLLLAQPQYKNIGRYYRCRFLFVPKLQWSFMQNLPPRQFTPFSLRILKHNIYVYVHRAQWSGPSAKYCGRLYCCLFLILLLEHFLIVRISFISTASEYIIDKGEQSHSRKLIKEIVWGQYATYHPLQWHSLKSMRWKIQTD